MPCLILSIVTLYIVTSKLATKKITDTQAKLRVIHADFVTPRDELLVNYKETHQFTPINLRCLMIEVYKSIHGPNPEFVWNLFTRKNLGVGLRRVYN